ncbi:MAG: hypothetical protein FWC77_07435 [Defluviitaleaceae bacterium]|nr:hypothetical protein [Defluviitaleaceae bacterium]
MAYETKVILTMLAEYIGRAKSVEEAYNFVVKAANAEGLQLPSYAEFQKELKNE